MSEGLVEGAIYDQVAAIESWALRVYQEAKKPSPNLDEILGNLKNINMQGRRLEWRKQIGMRNLPNPDLAKDLKKKVSEIRAAAMSAFGDIKKEKTIARGVLRTLKMLTAETVELKKTFEKMPSVPFEKFKTDNILLEDFLRGEKSFANLDQETRRTLWNNYAALNKLRLIGLDLSNVDLRGFDFSEMYLKEVDFSYAQLVGTVFVGSRISDCTFNVEKSYMSRANFKQSMISRSIISNISGSLTVHLNFNKCYIMNSTINNSVVESGDFSSVRFNNVKLNDVFFSNCNFQRARLVFEPSYSNVRFGNSDLRSAVFEFKDSINLQSLPTDSLSGADVNGMTFIVRSEKIKSELKEKILKHAKNGSRAKIRINK